MSVKKSLEPGTAFGHLTVLRPAVTTGDSASVCKCSCGRESVVFNYNLKNGHTKSCGCKKGWYKHGAARDGKVMPEYNVWQAMKDRCLNSRNPSFANYGGRGIGVCDRWAHSFNNFLQDIGRRPSNKHSIDRIDNDGNYEPSNCRWVTRDVQNSNTRRNHVLQFDGQEKTLSDWANISGVKYHVLRHRIKAGWPVELALSAPIVPREARRTWRTNSQREA